jgi:DNA (cytosine-5)-methyltransferase 1
MKKLRVLDLFSGIGGFSLGLERTGGFETVAFCEIEPFCQRVLSKHWPEVPIYDDVRELNAAVLRRDGISVDVICGGFPCQDISAVGAGAGIDGAESGLWSEYARLICELRPRYVIVENVAALLVRGIGRVLGDMAALGYDAEWECIPACAVAAPHTRDRVWIVAYPDQQRPQARVAGRNGHDETAHARRGGEGNVYTAAFAASGYGRPTFAAEPKVDRVADGVPDRVDALAALGNSMLPQIPELIGRAILEAEGMKP